MDFQLRGNGGLLAEVKAGATVPTAADQALAVIHRPDDPLFNASYLAGPSIAAATASHNNILSATAVNTQMLGDRAIGFQVNSASTTGTLVFEGSNDGSVWFPVPCTETTSMATLAALPVSTYNLTAANRTWLADCDYQWFRVRLSAVTATGAIQAFGLYLPNWITPTVQLIRMTDGTNLMPTMDALARKGFFQLTDGTTGLGVKAASTPAVVADPTIPVAISPNLPVPTPFNLNSAASTNATSVKASAGTLLNLCASNQVGAVRYLKLYNKASAPTVGTDIPVLTITLPAAGMAAPLDMGTWGLRFSTGIAFAITALATDADATAVALGDVKVFLNYI